MPPKPTLTTITINSRLKSSYLVSIILNQKEHKHHKKLFKQLNFSYLNWKRNNDGNFGDEKYLNLKEIQKIKTKLEQYEKLLFEPARELAQKEFSRSQINQIF